MRSKRPAAPPLSVASPIAWQPIGQLAFRRRKMRGGGRYLLPCLALRSNSRLRTGWNRPSAQRAKDAAMRALAAVLPLDRCVASNLPRWRRLGACRQAFRPAHQRRPARLVTSRVEPTSPQFRDLVSRPSPSTPRDALAVQAGCLSRLSSHFSNRRFLDRGLSGPCKSGYRTFIAKDDTISVRAFIPIRAPVTHGSANPPYSSPQSRAKTITAMLICQSRWGRETRISRLGRSRLGFTVPGLCEHEYGGHVPLRALCWHMSPSGVRFTENYDGSDDITRAVTRLSRRNRGRIRSPAVAHFTHARRSAWQQMAT